MMYSLVLGIQVKLEYDTVPKEAEVMQRAIAQRELDAHVVMAMDDADICKQILQVLKIVPHDG